MQQQPSPKSLKVCAIFNGCFSVAFDKLVRFFSPVCIHTHGNSPAGGVGGRRLWPRTSPPCKRFKRGCNPNGSGVRRGWR